MTQTAVATLYVHDLDDHIIAETDASGQTLREYIWLGDIPLAVVDKVATGSPMIYYVHADHLGRPARMTAQNQAWVWDVIYSPFGETSYIWTNPGTIDIRFPGQWFQLESGLHYNWHRHYDATLGRYVQPDPLGHRGGRNLYDYVKGNPLSATDPRGLETLVIINNNTPLIGTHAGVIIESGGNTSIYDPGGSYRANAGRGSDDTITGPDVNFQDYLRYQQKDGPNVNIHRYNTTPDEENQLRDRIEDQGACFPGLCARCTSNALSGVGPFRKLPLTWTPRGLHYALP